MIHSEKAKVTSLTIEYLPKSNRIIVQTSKKKIKVFGIDAKRIIEFKVLGLTESPHANLRFKALENVDLLIFT